MALDVLALTKELIERESVTPNDAGCQQLMCEHLSKLGFEIESLVFHDTTNFWAKRKQAEPVVIFAGHTDVVPPGPADKWDSPAFEPTIRDGKLFGRGAADMKGSLAAMLCATEQFVTQYPEHKGSIAFLITSDEEGDFINGTVKVVEHLQQRNEPLTYCVVGEPSSTNQLGDVVKVGRRGSLTGHLQVHGKQGHVAYPHLAENAIHHSMEILHELAHTEFDQGNEFFPPSTLQITAINAGTASNVVPGEIKVRFNIRFSTEQTDEKLKQSIEKIFSKLKVPFDLEWQLMGQPFLTEKVSPLITATQKAIKDVMQFDTELSTAGGTSDGRFIAPTGCHVVELGPCNASIHQVNENVAVEQLYQLTDCYFKILENLLEPVCPSNATLL